MKEDTTDKSLEADLKEEVGLVPLFAVAEKTPALKPKDERPQGGRLSLAITKNFSYRRDLSLFDGEEIRKRDEELEKILSDRGEKFMMVPNQARIILSPVQDRLISVLSCFLDPEDEKVREKINSPFAANNPIELAVPIALAADLTFGRRKREQRSKVLEEIENLSKIRQAQIFKIGENTFKLSAPYIQLGVSLETLDPESLGELDHVNITYGAAFFVGLGDRYAAITPKLLEVSRKKPYQTELFVLLKNLLLSVYWQHSVAAKSAEERVRREKRKEKLTDEVLDGLIREAKFLALSFEIDVDTIISKLKRNYDDRRRYSEFKKKELPTAVGGFVEMDLLTGYEIVKGKKNQDKVIFHFSETYTTFSKQPLKLPNATPSGNTPSAF